MRFGCLYVEESAFHDLFEGFAVRAEEEVSCPLLLLLGLSVNGLGLIPHSHAFMLCYGCLCLNALAFGLAFSAYCPRVLLNRPLQLLVPQPTTLDLLLHFLYFPTQLPNYPLFFQTFLSQQLSLLLRNAETAPQLLYFLLQLLVFHPAGLKRLDELSDFQLFIGAEID